MKVGFAFLLLTTASSLSQPKYFVKSRSVVSLETASGVKANLPVAKKDKKNYDETYWLNPYIHTLGNVGALGALHAALAPLSTHLIDNLAYGGIDIRLKVRVTTVLKPA